MGEKRRSQRLPQKVTIQLAGAQPGSSPAVAQPAETIDVSDEGALVECRSRFAPGAEVIIHNPKNLHDGLFRVLRANPSPGGAAWIIALELLDLHKTDFWGQR